MSFNTTHVRTPTGPVGRRTSARASRHANEKIVACAVLCACGAVSCVANSRRSRCLYNTRDTHSRYNTLANVRSAILRHPETSRGHPTDDPYRFPGLHHCPRPRSIPWTMTRDRTKTRARARRAPIPPETARRKQSDQEFTIAWPDSTSFGGQRTAAPDREFLPMPGRS